MRMYYSIFNLYKVGTTDTHFFCDGGVKFFVIIYDHLQAKQSVRRSEFVVFQRVMPSNHLLTTHAALVSV